MKNPIALVCAACVLFLFNQTGHAATFTLAEKPEYRAPMVGVCQTLGIRFQEDVRISILSRVMNGIEHAHIETPDYYFLIRNYDKQVTLGVNKALSGEIYRRKPSGPGGTPPKNTRLEMEKLARATAAKLGITLDDPWKYWLGWRGVPEGNYHKSHQEWAFLWNRHFGKHPIGNEYVIVHLDDLTQQLVLFHNTTTTRKYNGLAEPKLTPEQGREAAIQAELIGREPRSYDDPTKFKNGTHDRMLTFYYVQELPLVANPKGQQPKLTDYKLRLCYGCYVGYWEKGKESEPIRVIDLEFVDALTGEKVVRNKND